MKKRIIVIPVSIFCSLACLMFLYNPQQIRAASATGTCSICGAPSSGTYDVIYTNANQNMHQSHHEYVLQCHANFFHKEHVEYDVYENHTVVNYICIYCGYDVRR